jgi:hypothetical protein
MSERQIRQQITQLRNMMRVRPHLTVILKSRLGALERRLELQQSRLHLQSDRRGK